jgi:hypothetical protein
VFIKKREDPCDHFPIPPIGCTPFGQYVYVWNYNGNNELYRQAMDEPLKLSGREKQLIESLIRSTTFGRETLSPDYVMVNDKDFIKLRERLKLDFTNSTTTGEQ